MQSHVKGKSADDDLGAHGCMFADGSPQNPSPMPQFILIKEKWGPEQVEKYERVKVEQSQARLHIALVFLLDLTMFEERTLRLNLVERGFPARSQESPKPLKVPVFQDPTISMEDLEGVEFPQNGYTCEQEQDKFLIQHADLPGLTVQPFGFNWMCTVQNKALIITFSHPISAAKDLFVYRFSGLLKSCLYLEESKVVYTWRTGLGHLPLQGWWHRMEWVWSWQPRVHQGHLSGGGNKETEDFGILVQICIALHISPPPVNIT